MIPFRRTPMPPSMHSRGIDFDAWDVVAMEYTVRRRQTRVVEWSSGGARQFFALASRIHWERRRQSADCPAGRLSRAGLLVTPTARAATVSRLEAGAPSRNDACRSDQRENVARTRRVVMLLTWARFVATLSVRGSASTTLPTHQGQHRHLGGPLLYGAYLVGFTFSRKRHDPDGLFDMRQIGLAVQNLMARRAGEHISNHNTRRAL